MSAREQILSTAARLFFTQGYAQTGINQLIDESEVAKRTFYHHFASKEALGIAYLDFAASEWLRQLTTATEGKRSATGVVRGVFDFVERFALDTQFRGCGILNMAAEFADAGSAVRTRVQTHKDAQRAAIRQRLAPHTVSTSTADQVDVLLEGAIAAAAAHLDVWPIRAAAQAASALVSPSSR